MLVEQKNVLPKETFRRKESMYVYVEMNWEKKKIILVVIMSQKNQDA